MKKQVSCRRNLFNGGREKERGFSKQKTKVSTNYSMIEPIRCNVTVCINLLTDCEKVDASTGVGI